MEQVNAFLCFRYSAYTYLEFPKSLASDAREKYKEMYGELKMLLLAS